MEVPLVDRQRVSSTQVEILSLHYHFLTPQPTAIDSPPAASRTYVVRRSLIHSATVEVHDEWTSLLLCLVPRAIGSGDPICSSRATTLGTACLFYFSKTFMAP